MLPRNSRHCDRPYPRSADMSVVTSGSNRKPEAFPQVYAPRERLLSEVLGGDVVEELAELLDLVLLLVGLEEHAGLVEDRLVGEDRHLGAEANGQRDRVRGT